VVPVVIATGQDPALGRSVEAVRRLFAAAACSVALVDEDGETLEFVASDGAGAEAIVGVSIPVSRGIAGWAAMSGQPIAVRDVQTDARFARDVAESTNYVPASILAAPMMTADGEVMGVTSVLDPSVEEASDWTLQVLGTLASQIAMLLAGGHGPSASSGPSPTEALGRDVIRVVEAWQAGQPGHAGPSGTRAPGVR
jgi:signal transduction protein with GAF and PtsI domain